MGEYLGTKALMSIALCTIDINMNSLDCLQAVNKHYSRQFARWDSTAKFRFEKSEIILKIPEDGKTTEGWKITPIFYPKVSNNAYYCGHLVQHVTRKWMLCKGYALENIMPDVYLQ